MENEVGRVSVPARRAQSGRPRIRARRFDISPGDNRVITVNPREPGNVIVHGGILMPVSPVSIVIAAVSGRHPGVRDRSRR